jgi:hypothetical protein
MTNSESAQGRQLVRLRELESKIRNLQLFLALLGIAAGTLIVTGARAVNGGIVTQTKRIELHGSGGERRVMIGMDEKDSPSLRLYDREGRERLSIELWPNGDPYINLINTAGVTQAELGLVNGDLPSLDFRDKEEEELVSLGINAYGSPSLEMSNGAYDHHLALTFFDDERPKLALYGNDFDDRAILGLDRNGDPGLSLYDRKERQRALLRIAASGAPEMVFMDESGKVSLHAPTQSKSD